MPLFCIVPDEAARAFGAESTFVVGATLNDRLDLGRRTVKPWGDGRWFIELTEEHCRRSGVAEGDIVTIVLSEVPAVPPDLIEALKEAALEDRWGRLTDAQRRTFCEHIFAARRRGTRTRRIAGLLACLAAPTDTT